MKNVVIIGVGPNKVEIPLIVMESRQKAIDFLESLGLQKSPHISEFGENAYEIDLEGRDDDLDESPERLKLVNALFKDGDYYGGCGECYVLKIQDIEFGKPMVGWDMD